MILALPVGITVQVIGRSSQYGIMNLVSLIIFHVYYTVRYFFLEE